MAETRETTVNFREYARIFRRRKWYLILAVLAVGGGAFGGSFFLTPQYQSAALVKLGDRILLGASVRSLTPQSGDRSYDNRSHAQKVEALRRRILSPAYLEQLIGRMGWVDNMLAEDGPEARSARTAADPRRALVGLLVGRMQSRILVNLISDDYVEITFSSADPAEAKSAATHLAEIFCENMTKEDVASIRMAGEFSEEQLEIYRKKWEEAQNRLANFKSQKVRQTVDDQMESERNLQDIVGEQDATKLEYSGALDRTETLKSQLGLEGAARADLIYSDRLNTLRNEQLSLIDRLGDLLGKYSWKDNIIVDYNYRLGTGLNNIQAEITRIIDETLTNLSPADHDAIVELVYLTVKVDFLKKRQELMSRTVNRIRDRLATGPEYEQQLRRLETAEAASRDIYNRFVEQYTGAQIRQAEERASAETKYTLIEPPMAPVAPVYPDRLKFTIAAVIIGLVFGFALVFLAEYNDHSFRSVEDVEEQLGFKVVATVPKIMSLKEARFAGKK